MLSVIVAYLLTTDVGDETTWWGRAIATVAVVLASLGYGGSRAGVKREALRKGQP